MMAVLQSPFFVLFCATSGVGTYLAHRRCVLEAEPVLLDRVLAIVAALLSIALSATCYGMRQGRANFNHVDPSTASVIAAFTGLGIAFVCMKVVSAGRETAEE